MKRIRTILFVFALAVGTIVLVSNAQMTGGMMDGVASAPSGEEAQGKAIWDKLQAKQVACGKLVDSDFDLLGEYFMGTMMGASHDAMNDRLKRVLGDAGETQIHVSLGKRMSGCDASAAYPAGFSGFMPMMGGQSYASEFNLSNSMMNFGYGFSFFGGIFMLLWWALIIAAVVALVKWFWDKSKNGGKSPLDILKERYAKGDIDRKEFEEKKKDLA